MNYLPWLFRLFFMQLLFCFFKRYNLSKWFGKQNKMNCNYSPLLYGIFPNLPQLFCRYNCKMLILLTMGLFKYCLIYSMLCRYTFQLESAVFWESLHNLKCAINRTCTQWKESVTYFVTVCLPQIQLPPKVKLLLSGLPSCQTKLLQCVRWLLRLKGAGEEGGFPSAE